MKVKRIPDTDFHPFDITITIESEEEAKALYAIFNYVPNTDLLSDQATTDIRKQIGEKFSHLGNNQIIANGIDYRSFYSPTTSK